MAHHGVRRQRSSRRRYVGRFAEGDGDVAGAELEPLALCAGHATAPPPTAPQRGERVDRRGYGLLVGDEHPLGMGVGVLEEQDALRANGQDHALERILGRGPGGHDRTGSARAGCQR